MARKNKPSDIFLYIDTHGNDPDVCWEWIGSLGGRDGRGYFTLDSKRQLAYRVIWQIFHGPIPEGQVVRHKCNNEVCCNPNHLQLGTQGDNETDKYKSNRQGYTHDMLKQMRRYDKLGMTYRAIAAKINEEFGTNVSYSGVGMVLRGQRRAKG